MAKILVVDAERALQNGHAYFLKLQNHQVAVAASTADALMKLQAEHFDLIISELKQPGIDGLDLLQRVREASVTAPVVIVTGEASVRSAVAAMKLGAYDFFEKPLEKADLHKLVHYSLRCKSASGSKGAQLSSRTQQVTRFDEMLAQSDRMLHIFQLIQSVGRTDANVLITGESGTGKELVARSIHARSQRKGLQFVPINCSALPAHLFEAELFGYEKGAFTGATQRKLGLLEFANHGTFFLDEVCDMPFHLQAKLLRVLQDKMLRHLGGNRLIPVDVRIISATNAEIEAAVRGGKLREDLFFRLNVVHIHLPPLRERKEDIRVLADHFLQLYLKSFAKRIYSFTEDVYAAFERYDWPGNVRELENVVEHAVAMAAAETISLADLPATILKKVSVRGTVPHALTLVEAKQKAVAEIERKYLLSQLQKHRGNVTRIAKESGMTRRNLHRLLNRHKLNATFWRMHASCLTGTLTRPLKK